MVPGGLTAPTLELSATTAVRGAVLAGAGPEVPSDLAVRADVAAGRLVRVAVDGLVVTRGLRAVRAGRPAPVLARPRPAAHRHAVRTGPTG